MRRGLQSIRWTREQCRQIILWVQKSQQICQQVQQVSQSQVENELCSQLEWLQQSNKWMINEKQQKEKLFWFQMWIEIHLQSQDDMSNV